MVQVNLMHNCDIRFVSTNRNQPLGSTSGLVYKNILIFFKKAYSPKCDVKIKKRGITKSDSSWENTMTNRRNMAGDLGRQGSYLRLHRSVHGGGLRGTVGEGFRGAGGQRWLLRSRASLG